MCFCPFSCYLEFLPYVLLVTIPFFGSFSGTELILRLSIIILAFITAGEFIPNVKYVLDIIPNCKACLLTALVICVPLSVIPYPAVWLYGWLLWLMEPVLLCIETVLALNLVMQFSRNCAEKIEEDEDEAWKWKLLLTLFSAGCYALLAVMVFIIFTEGSDIQFWLVMLVLSFSVLLAAHNMMWMSHQGIISDVAFVTLSSMLIVYVMREEIALANHPLQKPNSWYRYHAKGSLWTETYKVVHMSLDSAKLAMLFLRRFISPQVMALLCIRLYSVVFLMHRTIRNCGLENDDLELSDVDEDSSPWRSPFLVKVAVVILVTQYTTQLYDHSCSHIAPAWPWSLLPNDIIVGRVFQVLLGNCFYIWTLYRADDWQLSDWFSND
ncbi:uncharacterized protein LOC128232907 [Mya arenaria]|uniref:uncharacterized protein LOC128232907 n=1 Tax=Mya arenaria TaxID=6604 RepID=UPI0022E2EABC|nr:uncharacterized protein LOC128232907 [Mya arenaria]